MKKNSSAPVSSEDNHLSSDVFLDSFFKEPNCSNYGWGPIQIYPAHIEILKQDTPSSAVYFIDQGLVKLTWMDQAGHEVIAGLRHQQWILGAASVLLDKPYTFSVTTLTQCALRCISAKNFLHLVRSHTEFTLQLMRMLCQEILRHGKKSVMLGCIPARDRLKNLLCRFIHDISQPTTLQKEIKIHLPLKHKEIAQIIAVTPEHLSRLLKELEQQGFMKRGKGGLILLDLVNLRQWADI
jgi:CRP/FNR family transcriptional regulator